MSKITVTRYHDFCYGHRVVGHESCCRHLHGHNGRIHFTCEAEQLDSIGRVIDFSVIKEKLCMWLENNWDHKTLLWGGDDLLQLLPLSNTISSLGYMRSRNAQQILQDSFVIVPFNPTAENMAQYLIEVICPQQLAGTGITVTTIKVEETRKCSASVSI